MKFPLGSSRARANIGAVEDPVVQKRSPSRVSADVSSELTATHTGEGGIMQGSGTSIRASSKRRAALGTANVSLTIAPATPIHSSNEALRQRKYRNLIRKHLGLLVDKLFAEFTGLHFHVSWAPPPPRAWDTRSMPTACSVCCRLSGSPLLKDCRVCGPRQLARALGADKDGQHFTCRLGVRNYWLPIRVRNETLGIAYLQALDHSRTKPRPRKLLGGAAQPHLRLAEARALSQGEFARAARLLQLIVQHVQTASLSDLRKADLASAGHAIVALEKEQARLHETLQRHIPAAPQTLSHYEPESHPEQVVHRLLECIEKNFGKPITLHQCANKLGMNSTYLSDLFSRTVGVPFKSYLTELRLQKAKELLGDTSKAVSDVAFAVGYASENRFRLAFKEAVGVPPRIWRETMQTNPPPR